MTTSEVDFETFMESLRSIAPWVREADDETIETFGDLSIVRAAMLGDPFMEKVVADPDDPDLKTFLDTMEVGLSHGSDTVQNSVSTGFLESIVGHSDRGKSLVPIVKYLGPSCIAYCRAWDEFNGSRTPGIWPRAVD